MELRLGITTWAEVAGLIVSVLIIVGTMIGAVSWFLRLENLSMTNKDNLTSHKSDTEKNFDGVKHDLKVLETRVETKVDSLQSSMNTVLVAMGEVKGQLRSISNRQAEG